MDAFSKVIDVEIANTMQKISAAAGLGDLEAVEQDTKKAVELKALKTQLEAIQSRFRTLRDGNAFLPSASGAFAQTPGALREFAVPVTQGMIAQSLLTLTEQAKRGQIQVGERLTLETFPGRDRFQTHLLLTGKKLQERGRIGKFYRDAAVRAGDTVLMVEITHGQWQLKKRA